MSVRDRILAAYEQLAENYNQLIDHKPHNAYYDRPNTMSMMEDVEGKLILDAACGPGKYAEELIALGASLIGFDFSPKMVDLARKRNSNDQIFHVHDLNDPLDHIEDEKYDYVLCALALHYIEDWTPVLKEFRKKLKKGGQLVLSIEHPFFNFIYYKSERYFEREEVSAEWRSFGMPVIVTGYRRSMGEVFSSITDAGFFIDKIFEPRPTAEFEKLDPEHFKELNEFPAFLCIRAIKGNIQ